VAAAGLRGSGTGRIAPGAFRSLSRCAWLMSALPDATTQRTSAMSEKCPERTLSSWQQSCSYIRHLRRRLLRAHAVYTHPCS